MRAVADQTTAVISEVGGGGGGVQNYKKPTRTSTGMNNPKRQFLQKIRFDGKKK
jgi:hypothetical protein